jgi:hypothetical protein
MIQFYQEVLLTHKLLMVEVLVEEPLLMLVVMEALAVAPELCKMEGLPQLDKEMMEVLVLPVPITA